MAVPLMRMGLVGFSDDRHLRNLLATRNRNVRWEPWTGIDADAFWVNGARVQPLDHQLVRIPAADVQQQDTVLDLADLNKPTAFTLPLGSPSVRAPATFDPHVAQSVAAIFSTFEAAVMEEALQLSIAAEIAARRWELSASTYHLERDGKLLAVVNILGDIGTAPEATPALLDGTQWRKRPDAAGAIPRHFRRFNMATAMWRHISRTSEDLLPQRYREGPIHFRAMPVVPPALLRDAHLVVMAELRSHPQQASELEKSTGLPAEVVTQTLAALYFAGGITMDHRKAAHDGVPLQDWSPSEPPGASGIVPPRPGTRPALGLPTVPTRLSRDG